MGLHKMNSRRRVLAAGTAALGMTISAAAVTLGTPAATAADPAADCAQPADIALLQRGDAVNGLTVTHGTTPQQFTGSVIGVLDDGIAPGVDMVMVDFGGADVVKAAGGIWQGMSGSPVYAADGSLIGAVAYGLSYGPSVIAGVTPFAEMDKYLANTTPAAATSSAKVARRVPVNSTQARAIAADSTVTRAQASEGFTQLPMPMAISGLSARRVAQLTTIKRAWAPKSAYVAGRSADAADPSTIVAGGNIAASMSYGDVTAAGVGTATSVCNGKVVGFGHPMNFLGATTLGLHPADALYIQPDSLNQPFKVANIGALAGTITEDRLTGITGTFASLPAATTVTSTVTYGDSSRTGSTDVYVPDADAQTVFQESLSNHDRVLDSVMPGSEKQTFTITGTDENGAPFTLSSGDTYSSDYDISGDSSYDLADLVWTLSALDGVSIDAITIGSTVSDTHVVTRLAGVQQWSKGSWRSVTGAKSAIAKPGKTLKLRLVLKTGGTESYRMVSIAVPAKAKGGYLELTGGNSDYSWKALHSVADAQTYLANKIMNDQIGLTAHWEGKKLGAKKVTTMIGGFDNVVDGSKSVALNIGGQVTGGGYVDCGVGSMPSDGSMGRGC